MDLLEGLNLIPHTLTVRVYLYIYIYIYSLYIKSPGLPIIKEAQASQHGHFG
jgi:hypothetical protein